VLGGQKIAAQLSAVIGQPSLTGNKKIPRAFRSESVSDQVQLFNDLTAAKQFVFIGVYSWLTFADGCG